MIHICIYFLHVSKLCHDSLTTPTSLPLRFCACWGVPANVVPALIKDPHWKAVSVIYGKWKTCVQRFVEAKQEAGVFGHSSTSSSAAPQPLDEFEVDETCVRKRDLGDDTVEWTEYVGMKRRGDPQSLYLEQRSLDKCKSKRKSNGGVSPPPYTKEEWLALADKKVRPGALQHSDGAKAYQQILEGVERDYVSHSTRNGGPYFVASSAASSTALAGTQSLDGWWGRAKGNLTGINAANENHLDAGMREAQWRHWFQECDRFETGGTVVRYVIEHSLA